MLNIVLPTMGSLYVVRAFLVVVSGGGSLVGNVLASGTAGGLQSVLAFFTNDILALFLIFVLVVVFLRFRPQGLIAPAAMRR